VKFKIKKGDKVVVLTGSDKGKTGKVMKIVTKRMGVIVEGVRTVKKHQKPQGTQAGGIVEKQLPIHYSNVALVK
jgi:large subunit ribosomal protein L24